MCLQDVKVPATTGCMVDGIMDQGGGGGGVEGVEEQAREGGKEE